MRVRFAPSPTGYLHIGGLRTALYNYLLARKHDGTFLLRIEDTDRSRFVADAERDILECLEWAGIEFDEGPGKGGEYGPYHQSRRSKLYEEIAEQLLRSGHAYVAFDTPEEIEEMKNRYRSDSNPNPRYDFSTREGMTNSLTLSTEGVSNRLSDGDEHVVRLLVKPGQALTFDDAIRGKVTFNSDTVDDQILVKSDGLPTYHLANIVDDHFMEITHVIRGEEWLPSTPKHILIYRALGWDMPQMAHLPLIMSPTGGKLSKRNAEKQGIPVSVAQYRAQGYEPEALVNFLALLGWNPGDGRELLDMSEMIEAFSLERVGQAGVQFDLQKLEWYNEQVLRSRPVEEIARSVGPELCRKYGDFQQSYIEMAVEMMLQRISFEKDILDADFLFKDPISYDEKSVSKRWKEDSSQILQSYSNRIAGLDIWSGESLENELKVMIDESGIGMGKIMFPVRLALTGQPSGPGVYEIMVLLGRETVIRRFSNAMSALNQGSAHKT